MEPFLTSAVVAALQSLKISCQLSGVSLEAASLFVCVALMAFVLSELASFSEPSDFI